MDTVLASIYPVSAVCKNPYARSHMAVRILTAAPTVHLNFACVFKHFHFRSPLFVYPDSKANQEYVFGGSKQMARTSFRVEAIPNLGGLRDGNIEPDDDKWHDQLNNFVKSDIRPQEDQLKKRIFFGFCIAIIVGAVLWIGGWGFTGILAFSVMIASCEYFELLRSGQIFVGMEPIPLHLSRACSIICTLMPIFTLYCGRVDVFFTSGAFVLTTAFLCQEGNPHFAQLSHLLFGLFYCGYLPCFWIMLRCCLTLSTSTTANGPFWHIIFKDESPPVGFISTLLSISCVIAADTCAFIAGKAFGRTPLSNTSPRKTWEGAISGFGGCILIALILSKIFSWPKSFMSAMLFGVLIFFGSLFGDLTESLIKRNAGVKDSGSLIPGHGGILDRVDSYIFTGALSYSFVKIFLLGSST